MRDRLHVGSTRPRARVRLLATALLLLSATLAACGTEPTANNDAPGGPSTPAPAQLVGDWIYGVISPTNFHDAYNGSWVNNAYGTSVFFEFAANGTYKQHLLIYTSAYSCKTQVFTYNEGRATFDATSIKLYPTKGVVKARDNCVPKNNFDRPYDAAAHQGDVYGWRFDTHPVDGKTYLLIGVGGNMSNPSYFRLVK